MMQPAVDDDAQVIPATPHYRVAQALGAGLGLREGEAFGLAVPRVDFLRRKVHVLSQAK